ncbi:hypothetical protein KLP28_13535 [Nocardioidaceae bacterium]|nr:hypothetical protein KLP28_13535 [Nocardioidaceae bacterium]
MVDDLRTFRDERPHIRCKTSAEALPVLARLRETGDSFELWLDHDLGEVGGRIDSIGPVIDELARAASDDEMYDLDAVVHTSNPAGADMMVRVLRRWGYPVTRVYAGDHLIGE